MEGTNKYRLPTEAEWEYACRAGTFSEFSFGDDPGRLGEYAWFGKNSNYKTHPVGTKKHNLWSLNDMHGSVWEWLEDDWHHSYDVAPDDGSAWVDNPRGTFRVIRGGCWSDVARRCRSAARSRHRPSYYYSNDIGFRLARFVALGP
jgi:formylglycine-generating enzyme required for sulfatase activity